MNKNEEKTKLHDPDVLSADADVQADVDSVMRKYDRESNTRIWEGKPRLQLLSFSPRSLCGVSMSHCSQHFWKKSV